MGDKVEAIKKPNSADGFTVIEIIVTIIIFIIFIGGAFQTYVVLESQRLYILRQTIASDIAYTNLRKFSTRPTIATCSSSINLATSTYNFTPETTTTNNTLAALGTPVTQTVVGYPVDGCSGSNFVSTTLKIVSTVTYSTGSASHATFVQ